MSCQLNKTGIVRFAYSPKESVKKVFLAGSFNDWKPVSMSKQKSGQFVKNLKVPTGIHEYKFIIDGVWSHDPDHDNHAHNALGTLNSLAVVA